MQVCPNCKHENRPGLVFCENCGASLIGDAPLSTRSVAISNQGVIPSDNAVVAALTAMKTSGDTSSTAAQATGALNPNTVIRIEISGTKPFLLRPKQEIVFGRKDPATGSTPDVDMTPYAGYRMGVSRRHAAIRKMEDNRLYLWDLGSANGTFLNNTRLTSYRPHLLHHGDEVRLSQIGFRIYFQDAPKSAGQSSSSAAPVPNKASASSPIETSILPPVRSDPGNAGDSRS